MRARRRESSGPSYYLISYVARAYRVHPQTLRLYERAGLIAPDRSKGNTRLYSREDLRKLERILDLTRGMGVNLAGVEVVLRLREHLARLQGEVDRLRSAAVSRRSHRHGPRD